MSGTGKMEQSLVFVAILLMLIFGFATFCEAQRSGYINVKDDFLTEINTLRKKHGRHPVVYNEKYQKHCDRWALRITKHLVHNSSDYFRGEVISHVPASEELVIGMFMRSDGHRKVLMDRKIKSICLSVYTIPRHQIIRPNEIEYIPDMFYTVIRTY